MTRRQYLAATLSALPLAALEAASNGLSPLDEQTFRQMVTAHRGKALLVDFWATWCAGCREEMPKLLALRTTYASQNFSLVTISCDEPEQERGAEAFLNKQSAPLPRYIKRAKDDDAFINSVDPKWSGALPALFLYGRSGQLAAKFIGESSTTSIDAAIKNALAAPG
jgi:thiol-disulfide isomerase/thioredoxin